MYYLHLRNKACSWLENKTLLASVDMWLVSVTCGFITRRSAWLQPSTHREKEPLPTLSLAVESRGSRGLVAPPLREGPPILPSLTNFEQAVSSSLSGSELQATASRTNPLSSSHYSSITSRPVQPAGKGRDLFFLNYCPRPINPVGARKRIISQPWTREDLNCRVSSHPVCVLCKSSLDILFPLQT